MSQYKSRIMFIHKYSEILHRTFRAENECKIRKTQRDTLSSTAWNFTVYQKHRGLPKLVTIKNRFQLWNVLSRLCFLIFKYELVS